MYVFPCGRKDREYLISPGKGHEIRLTATRGRSTGYKERTGVLNLVRTESGKNSSQQHFLTVLAIYKILLNKKKYKDKVFFDRERTSRCYTRVHALCSRFTCPLTYCVF